ncbi:MAG TPA: HAD family phosphatase [Candidatus Binatia bacterium]|nr:HAD family phosphatase [Candidatus Binatia bacterium]
MIKAIIFDFFGVIVGDGFDATYRYAGGDPEADRDFIETLLEQSNRGLISTKEFRSRICSRLNISVEQYKASVKKSEQPNLELLEYIKKLRRNYKTAILSNVGRDGLERRIKREVLNQYFDVTVVSADVGFIKPEPQIYELTAKKLGVEPSECIFTDDREGYVSAAANVGIKAFIYKDFAQAKAEIEKLLSAGADN